MDQNALIDVHKKNPATHVTRFLGEKWRTQCACLLAEFAQLHFLDLAAFNHGHWRVDQRAAIGVQATARFCAAGSALMASSSLARMAVASVVVPASFMALAVAIMAV